VSQTFSVSGTTDRVTGVSAGPLPIETSLDQNFPNPFNPTTTIRFSLSQSGVITLSIYNILGQHVETLLNQPFSRGSHSVHWSPEGLPSGVYYYRLQTGEFTKAKHLIFLR
jgi:hypothetical protein